jgi:XTP/dITP diphosphohydrolase
MQKLLIATKNKGKIEELSKFLVDLPLKLVSLEDVGITDNVEEDGKTYLENSQKKALFYARKSKLPAISDDGGLEIVALDNKPGVHSRRWLGYEASDDDLLNHLQKIAKELPDNNREAYFKTVVSFALPDGKVWSKEGDVKGIIARKPLAKFIKGYPYRSFFFLPELNKFYHESEFSQEEEELYNHRYKAIQGLKAIIKNTSCLQK